MFYDDGYIVRSDTLCVPGVKHGFATRRGGVSTVPAAAQMNLVARDGDSEENAARNVSLFSQYAGLGDAPVIFGDQIHSASVLTVNMSDTAAEPFSRKCDGYVTDTPGLSLMIRCADCVPILMCGTKEDGSPVIAAVHAGWKGTVGGIAAEGVRQMCALGAVKETIRTAAGPSIRECCFEVKEDFYASVTAARGADFAARHIKSRDGRLYANLQSMNAEILRDCGITAFDCDAECTCHNNEKYHSHRASHGVRGVGGGIIGITGEL